MWYGIILLVADKKGYDKLEEIIESEVISNVLLTAVPLNTRACLSRAEQHYELLMWKALSISSLSI